jgi:ankyrin repeat protein
MQESPKSLKELTYLALTKNPNLSEDERETILFYASQHGYVKVILSLFSSGFNLHRKGDRALVLAVAWNQIPTIKLLLRTGSNPNNRLALQTAAVNGNWEIMEMLFKKMKENPNSLLLKASEYGYSLVIERLIRAGADIHYNNDEPLQLAVQNIHRDVVDILLSYGGYNEQVLSNALLSFNEHIFSDKTKIADITRALLEAGGDVHYLNDQALITASMKFDFQVVKVLVDFGANIDARDGEALKNAMSRNQTEMIVLFQGGTESDKAYDTMEQYHDYIGQIVRQVCIDKDTGSEEWAILSCMVRKFVKHLNLEKESDNVCETLISIGKNCKNVDDVDIFDHAKITSIPFLYLYIHDGICFNIINLYAWSKRMTKFDKNSFPNPITSNAIKTADIDKSLELRADIIRSCLNVMRTPPSFD